MTHHHPMPEIVTTYLQMSSPDELVPARFPDPDFVVREAVERQWQLNRSLYLRVGEQWEWSDKRGWSDAQWEDYVACDQLRTFVASWQETTLGYYELRRDDAGSVEIAYFGLVPDFIGRGFGGALLTDALEQAWAWDARRHDRECRYAPRRAALRNYQSRGMKVYNLEIRS
jgi:GNAT superfamily N-acetyltransferase